MKTALIWYTWFVWSNILDQKDFDDKYNSSNIDYIKWKNYDLVICAWVKAVKRRANQNPELDKESIDKLIINLKKLETKKFILISTIDVYPNPTDLDEDFDFNSINKGNYHSYGKNRLYLENFIKSNFKNYNIIRLPGLFWKNLKKNVIFDLLNNNQIDKIIPNTKFQYYYLWNIWKDIEYIILNDYKEVNLVTEPIETKEIINSFFPKSHIWEENKNPIEYNIKTKYKKDGYFYNKKEILNYLETYIKNYKN